MACEQSLENGFSSFAWPKVIEIDLTKKKKADFWFLLSMQDLSPKAETACGKSDLWWEKEYV